MMQKTWKREVAGLALLIVFAGWGITLWQALVHDQWSVAADLVGLILMPVLLFAAAAFGIDAYSKQIKGGHDA